jgi:sugar/nucleoside kinase (ribokinase family)
MAMRQTARTPRFDVAVAGELNLDLILYGLPEELPLERELLADRLAVTLGGSSAIVCHNLASLGCRVAFISKIGRDPLGQIALERLAESGVDITRMRRAEHGDTGLSVILQRNAGRTILTHLGTIAELSYEDLDLDYLTSARHFHLSSFFLQSALQPRVSELFGKLKAAGMSISLDTNDDPDDRWQGGLWDVLKLADVFLPNEREATRITGCEDVETALERLAEVVPLVVVKMGAQGAIAQRGNERFKADPVKVETVDPIGAGDSFDAGFLSQYLRGADLQTCLAWGNRAGAFSTTRTGGTEAFRDRAWREEWFGKTAP